MLRFFLTKYVLWFKIITNLGSDSMNQLNTPKMNLNVIRTLVILGQSKSIYEGMKKHIIYYL